MVKQLGANGIDWYEEILQALGKKTTTITANENQNDMYQEYLSAGVNGVAAFAFSADYSYVS